jgi:hypothetical protein
VAVKVVNQHATAEEEGVDTRVTLPEKPETLLTSRAVCCSDPSGIATDPAPSVMEKSEEAELTPTERDIDLDRFPLVPVTVTEYKPGGVEV